MAQSFGQSPDPPPAEPHPIDFSMPDPAAIQKVLALSGQLNIDSHQKTLLQALQPYLSDQRIHKLEKAMRAAKLANLASTAFSSGALSSIIGR
jgi:hypothetical protein